MSKRFQASTSELTRSRLEAVREALSLEPGEKALLLDEIAQIAYWVVRQAMAGRRIIATRDDQEDPQVLEHVSLEALRAPVRLELDAREASRLLELLQSTPTHSKELSRTLETLHALSEPFSLEWDSSK